MSALDSLARVHRWTLDEKRQRLAELERYLEELDADLERLEDEIRSERAAALETLAGTAAFPTYVAAALERRRRLLDSRASLVAATEAARAEVNEAYAELKTFELARDNQHRRARAAREKKAQADLDELGIALHRRGEDPDSS